MHWAEERKLYANFYPDCNKNKSSNLFPVLVSIVVSIPACHAGDRGSIPRRGALLKRFSLLRAKKFSHPHTRILASCWSL